MSRSCQWRHLPERRVWPIFLEGNARMVFDVYLEIGTKRAFAAAVDWPGWCRHGPTEADALTALIAYAPKYQSILSRSRLGFKAPTQASQLSIVERLEGNATTDFGAPAVHPTADQERTCDAATLKRFETILRAGWKAFDAAVESARGKTLRTGPRGGGRSLAAIIEHVMGAEAGYLAAVGGTVPSASSGRARLEALRDAALQAMYASAAGAIPVKGPRGGMRWTARYYVRRVAWHVISHAWEIERRAAPA